LGHTRDMERGSPLGLRSNLGVEHKPQPDQCILVAGHSLGGHWTHREVGSRGQLGAFFGLPANALPMFVRFEKK